MHAACLRSYARVGARIKLYVYERPIDVPSNVEIADANAIIRREKIFRHKKSNSYAVFVDFFRYVLLQKTNELYVDCDMFCLRKIEPAEYIYGYEDKQYIAIGILRIPSNSALLKKLIHIASFPLVFPPWMGRRQPLEAFGRNLLGDGPTARHLDWASTGPRALTYYANQLNLSHHASPVARFYPIGWREVAKMFDPNISLADVIDHNTDFVHLSNEVHRRENFGEPPKGSILYNLMHDIVA